MTQELNNLVRLCEAKIMMLIDELEADTGLIVTNITGESLVLHTLDNIAIDAIKTIKIQVRRSTPEESPDDPRTDN